MDSKKKIDIAFIMGQLHIGGTEMALASMLKLFDYDRYKIDLWVNPGGELDLKRIPDTVKVNYWSGEEEKPKKNFRSLWYKALSKKNVNDFNRNLKFYIKSQNKICEKIYDYLVCYYGYSDDVLFTSLYHFNARRRLLWVHGNYHRTRQNINFWKKEYSQFDRIICVSKSNRELFLCKYTDLGNRTHVIYNVLDMETIQKLAEEAVNYEFDEYTIVTVGRLSQEKGQDLIPEVALRLINQGLPVRWYIIGEGATKEEIKQNIKMLNIEDQVVLTGQVENPYPFIKKCALYVQPSRMEGYCVSTLEAKALGKVVVTTDVPGMREQFVDGENGFIINSCDVNSLFDSIYMLLKEKKKMNCVQEKKQISEFLKNIDSLESLYELLV